ncbi:LapA family protein [Novosphingobium sp.]|uniref:LapA family protein n=1 Tax=Novosphingobium sp. TaxID=1874826 RepID=UPI0033418703
MRGLKIGWVVLLVVVLFAFTYANPDPIAVHIWPGLIWETKASALVIGALLIGFVPTSLINRATQWRLNRRIAALEATLATQTIAMTNAQSNAQSNAQARAADDARRTVDLSAMPNHDPI